MVAFFRQQTSCAFDDGFLAYLDAAAVGFLVATESVMRFAEGDELVIEQIFVDKSARSIVETAERTGAKVSGPVPLPTEKNLYCVIRSPFKDKDSREHFEIRTHKRLIDILQPTPKTVDSLMRMDLPAGVDIEIKL